MFFLLLLSQINWEVVNFPEKIDIHGLATLSKNVWIVCGKDGMIGITKDGGKKWKIVHIPPHYLLTSVEAISEDNIWAVGERGWIVHMTENGEWQTIRVPASYHLLDVFFSTPSDGWAVGDWGEVLHWNGMEWIEKPMSIFAQDRGIMEPIASESILDRNGKILVRKGERIPDELLERLDRGEFEGKIRYDVVLNVIRKINNDIWIGGENGRLFVKSNEDWNEINLGEEEAENPSIFSVSPYHENNIIAVGTGGYIVKVHIDGGWEEIKKFTDKDILSIDVKGHTICIAGNDGLAGISVDGGKKYFLFEKKEYTYHWFRKTKAISDGTCLFVGMNGTVIKVKR